MEYLLYGFKRFRRASLFLLVSQNFSIFYFSPFFGLCHRIFYTPIMIAYLHYAFYVCMFTAAQSQDCAIPYTEISLVTLVEREIEHPEIETDFDISTSNSEDSHFDTVEREDLPANLTNIFRSAENNEGQHDQAQVKDNNSMALCSHTIDLIRKIHEKNAVELNALPNVISRKKIVLDL